jgi:hypothetical protein
MSFFWIGTYSFLLTIMNIVCIYIFAAITFKFKVKIAYPGKTQYWEYLKKEKDAEKTIKGTDSKNIARRLAALRRAQNRSSGGGGGASYYDTVGSSTISDFMATPVKRTNTMRTRSTRDLFQEPVEV